MISRVLIAFAAASLAGCPSQNTQFAAENSAKNQAPFLPSPGGSSRESPETPSIAGENSDSLDPDSSARIDTAMRAALLRDDTAGAVLLVVANHKIVFQEPYGLRSKLPERAKMMADSIFDLASLTKAIVTSTSIALLIEQGQVRLNDRIVAHLPELNAQDGKEEISIEHLLLHTSGLPSSNTLSDYTKGLSHALSRIAALKLNAKPGTRYEYSDLGYILLGALIEKKSGQSLDVFAQKHFFGPLEMKDTGFRPGDPKQKSRIALTESRDGHFVAGEVHDPRARLLGGVAGHAGLFSSAGDLSRFAQMLLKGGKYHRVDAQSGAQSESVILGPASLRLLMEARALPGEGDTPSSKQRTLGWEVRTPITDGKTTLSNLGHTGFTGTSIWLYPEVGGAVILLTNRLHPDGKGNISRLRGEIAALVAPLFLAMASPKGEKSDAMIKALPAKTSVLSGLDVLKRDAFRPLQHKRIGLVTHPAGISADNENIIDLLKNTKGIELKKLFSPEHGLRGDKDSPVEDGRDPKTGLPVISLYGPRTRPRKEDLSDIDALVVDLQDAGCRFYTYISTLGYLLESAALNKKQIFVLDRPNPIGGIGVEGPLPEKESFTAYHPLPLRHGMTLGELARFLNEERKIGADLQVIAMEGWKRSMLFSDTRLPWLKPSPNMKSPYSALLYPGIGLLETTNISVGRGTDSPFQKLGAPFIDGRALANQMALFLLKGVSFNPIEFIPESSTHAGLRCGGIEIVVGDPRQVEPVRIGLSLAHTLKKLYPSHWKAASLNTLLANTQVLQFIQRGDHPDQVIAAFQPDLNGFMAKRRRYLIYGD